MEMSDGKVDIEPRGLKISLTIYLVLYISFGLLETLPVVWTLFRAPEELHFPYVGFFLVFVLSMCALGFLVSILLGKWLTFSLVEKFKNQHVAQGVVVDNTSSILGNVGFNLAIGVLFGASFGGRVLCKNVVTVNDLTTFLYCGAILSSLFALFADFILGLNSWLIYQVNSIEKETNQKMLVQFYSTGQWSWLVHAGTSAVAAFIVVLMFYTIFTVGQS